MRGVPDRVPEYIFPGNFRHGLSLNPSIHLNPSSDKNMENGFGRHFIIIYSISTGLLPSPPFLSVHPRMLDLSLQLYNG